VLCAEVIRYDDSYIIIFYKLKYNSKGQKVSKIIPHCTINFNYVEVFLWVESQCPVLLIVISRLTTEHRFPR